MTVADRVRAHATAFPDKVAVKYLGPKGEVTTRTFGEVDGESDALAAGLVKEGLRRGDRTIVMMPIGPPLVTLVLALVKVGAVPVLVDPGMGLRRMLHCYRTTGATAFIGVAAAHMLRRLRPRTFAKVTLALTPRRLRALARSGGEFTRVDAGPDDLLMIGFTTGSTGAAKGTEVTHGSLDATLDAVVTWYGFTGDDVCLVTGLPFLFLHLLVGATSVVPAIDFRRVARADPAVVERAIVEHGVTAFFASPALLHPLSRRVRSLPSVRCVVSGGAPVDGEVVERLRAAIGGRFHTTYGATEATLIASIDSDELPMVRAEVESGHGVCVGRPLGGTSVRVVAVGPETPLRCADLPVGEIGEIVISGPGVSRRYLTPVEANGTMKIVEGDRIWHRTGDVGRLDSTGRVWFCGRRTDVVSTSDGPLYPVACEAILNRHEKVLRTAVVRGRSGPVVCVELLPGVPRREWPGVVAGLRDLAAAYPATEGLTRFVRRASFPVDPRHNAKIDRAELARHV